MLDLLESKQSHWAFPIESVHQEKIRSIAETFHCSDAPWTNQNHARDEFVSSLNSVVDAGFYFYYGRPSEQSDALSPVMRKVADSVVNTVRKSIHMVIQRVFKKMSLSDLKVMSCYMDSMVITNPDDNQSYIAFPLSDGLRQQFIDTMGKIKQEEHIESYSAELAELFGSVVKDSAHYYYRFPTEMVNIGGFAKKAADLGIDTTVKGLQSLIRRVLKDISHKDVENFPDTLDRLIYTFDVPYATCTSQYIENK